jgi:hypothetical protein
MLMQKIFELFFNKYSKEPIKETHEYNCAICDGGPYCIFEKEQFNGKYCGRCVRYREEIRFNKFTSTLTHDDLLIAINYSVKYECSNELHCDHEECKITTISKTFPLTRFFNKNEIKNIYIKPFIDNSKPIDFFYGLDPGTCKLGCCKKTYTCTTNTVIGDDRALLKNK